MNERPLKPVRPGGQFSASELNRALQKVGRTDLGSGANVSVSDELGQTVIADVKPPTINMRIMVGDGSGFYAWEEVVRDSGNSQGGTSSFDEATADAGSPWIPTGNRSGTIDESPARERSGNGDVPIDTVVEGSYSLDPNGEGQWLFDYQSSSSSLTIGTRTVHWWFDGGEIVGNTSYQAYHTNGTPRGHVKLWPIQLGFSNTVGFKGPGGGAYMKFKFFVIATGGTYKLRFNGSTLTSSLNYNDNAATVEAALDAATSPVTWTVTGNPSVSGFTCTADTYGAAGWTIESRYDDYSTLTPSASVDPVYDGLGLFSADPVSYLSSGVYDTPTIAVLPVDGDNWAIVRPGIPFEVGTSSGGAPVSPGKGIIHGPLKFIPETGLQISVSESDNGSAAIYNTLANAGCMGVVPKIPDETNNYRLRSLAGTLQWNADDGITTTVVISGFTMEFVNGVLVAAY